jgi:hypothetical protein
MFVALFIYLAQPTIPLRTILKKSSQHYGVYLIYLIKKTQVILYLKTLEMFWLNWVKIHPKVILICSWLLFTTSLAGQMLELANLNGVPRISFEEFLAMLHSRDQDGPPGEGPDAKVLEFLRILDEYRLKCEEEGNYMEAGRAAKQLDTLKQQEEKRQGKALKARQIAERQDVQIAHNMQYSEFNQAWDRYLEEYDQMAQMYIQQMTERHAVMLREFQENLHKELMSKPPKFSKELLDWRRRQHMLAKQKQYSEAQKIKRVADVMEERERQKMDAGHRDVFERREAKLRSKQAGELSALLKRIDGRRKEHIKQRNLDSKRCIPFCWCQSVSLTFIVVNISDCCSGTGMYKLCLSRSSPWRHSAVYRTSKMSFLWVRAQRQVAIQLRDRDLRETNRHLHLSHKIDCAQLQCF